MTPEQARVFWWRRTVGLNAALLAPAVRDVELNIRMVHEESQELCAALLRGDLVEVADAYADLKVVLEGVASSCGFDGEPIFDEVMASNETKEPGNKDDGGKLLKGPGFRRPDLAPLLVAQGWKP
jgi:hypothetical protein